MEELLLSPKAFSIYKNFRTISIGNFRLRREFHFVTSSVRGNRGGPGRLKDRERYGTSDEDEKSINGTQISIGKFGSGIRDYLFRNSVYSGKFPVERTQTSCAIYIPTGISGQFW